MSKLHNDLANCIRFLSIDAVQKANSGHPGMPMGMADVATVLFKYHLRFNPKNPNWINRDRFILSAGHGSMLLYSLLYLTGYKSISLKDVKNFRQLDSICAGHPEYEKNSGIETTTGPLGQGISNAVFLQKKGFNVTIFDRDNPGSQAASYGNAGHFSPYASLSLNRTDVLADVPAMLLSSSGPLALKWNYVPKMIPWFVKFIMNTTKSKMMHTAKHMHQILALALPAYDEFFQEVDLEGLLEKQGIQ